MLLTVGKFMIAAALTLAAITTVFVVLFFREEPEPVAASEPVEKTTEEKTVPADLSQPWLDIPDPKPQPAPKPKPTPEPEPKPTPEPEPTPEPKPRPVAAEPEPPRPEPVAEPLPVEESDSPLPDRSAVEATKEPRRYELPAGAIMGLTVPAIGIFNAPVFDSDRRWALDSGVAHVPETSLPWSNTPRGTSSSPGIAWVGRVRRAT